MDEINAEAAKTAKKAAARAKKRADAGWEDIVPAAARWVAKDVRASSKGARLVRFSRRASISDVYLELLTPSILRACRKVAQKPVVYRGRKDRAGRSVQDVCLEYLHAGVARGRPTEQEAATPDE